MSKTGKRRKPVKYVCDHSGHEWCSHTRGVVKCPHVKPHVKRVRCHGDSSVCICWGIMNPFDGHEESIHVQCKRVEN